MQKLFFGIDVFLGQIDQFKNFRFALVTNNAATTSDGSLSRVALMKQGANLIKLFSPEHGLTAFKIVGAPWMNAAELHRAVEALQFPGVRSEPFSYKPISGLYAAEECHGVKLTITDPVFSRPVSTGLQIIALINSLYPEHCEERLYKTRANPTGEKHLDKLIGLVDSFRKIKNGEIRAYEFNGSAWRHTVQPYLHYE